MDRICDAARELFAARGYHGATTREIAKLADVSETLLFRYHGSKAKLFEFVVYEPFNQLMQKFLEERPKSADPRADEQHIVAAAYELFEKNEPLFTALLTTRGVQQEDGRPPFSGLVPFFEAGTREQIQKYTAKGQLPKFDMGVGLRLSFGMLAASILLREWLFPEGAPPREKIVAVLQAFVYQGLGPPATD
jgi:AcrR family transcriptional regulator